MWLLSCLNYAINAVQCKITEIAFVTFETAFKKDLILAKHSVRNVKKIHKLLLLF